MSDDFYSIARRVSNWGRWGKDDQRGTLNFITPDVIVRAAGVVRQGRMFRVGLDFAYDGPQSVPSNRPHARFNPKLYMLRIGELIDSSKGDFAVSDDAIHMPLQASTQWDGLGHVQYEGKLYNGFEASKTFTAVGTSRNGIEHAASPGIISRAVLLDIARLHNVDRLPPDFRITPQHLEAACSSQHVEVERGDIVMVRTGHIACFTKDKDMVRFRSGMPGLTMACALWLHDRDVVAVCADNSAVEAMPSTGPVPLPLHMLCLRDMGLYLGEFFDFDALAADCAEDGVYVCLLCAAALPVRGAVGSPTNPIALK